MTENEQKYFEAMLKEQFINVQEKINALKQDTQDILVQTTITNGRVTKLENWRAESRGYWKAASVIGAAIGSLIGFALTLWFKE